MFFNSVASEIWIFNLKCSKLNAFPIICIDFKFLSSFIFKSSLKKNETFLLRVITTKYQNCYFSYELFRV